MSVTAQTNVWISGTGLFTPSESITNEELVDSFNEYVRRHNETHAEAIAEGSTEALTESSPEFILKASGIQRRHVVEREGILDPDFMTPRLEARSDEDPSVLCEMGLAAAEEALEQAGKSARDVDCVIVACSNLERPYPAISVEIQSRLGAPGFAYDMNVACSSATFGLQAGVSALQSGAASGVLVVSPEVCTGHLNFRDRDSHFIFGDAATAVFVERSDEPPHPGSYLVLGTRLVTQFSNNIRNNFGFLNRATPETVGSRDKLFVQEGRKVFKEVVPLVVQLISEHLDELELAPEDLKRLWLHQANSNMNELIARRLLGDAATPDRVPTILDTYANTSSAGSVIAFHLHRDDIAPGERGILCSFGAGYSAGSVVVQRAAETD
ncbi:MAG: beta-ketoacyl-ACP synthase III [Acidobacteriota bacterium]